MTEEFERRKAAASAPPPPSGYDISDDRAGNWGKFKNWLGSYFPDNPAIVNPERQGAYGQVTGQGQVLRNQSGGYVPHYYQDGGYVSPQNNTRRLLNQARRRYGRNS